MAHPAFEPTAFARGSGLSAAELAVTVGRLVLFLAALLGIGTLVIPRAVRWIRHLDRPETTLVAGASLTIAVRNRSWT